MSTARQRRGYAGVTKLRRTLRRLEPEVTIGVRNVLEKGAAAIEADMLINIPKDTGDTASFIQSKVARDGLTARVGFIDKKNREAGFKARFIEYGTKGSPKQNVPPQPARPFMAPAFDANRDWIVEAAKKEIGQVINEVAEGDGTNE